MENTDNFRSILDLAIKNKIGANGKKPQIRAHIRASDTQTGHFTKTATGFQKHIRPADYRDGAVRCNVKDNGFNIAFRAPGEPESHQALSPASRASRDRRMRANAASPSSEADPLAIPSSQS